MAYAVRADEFEQVVGQFFARWPQTGPAVEIALDDKTLRGTLPVGQTHGVHLLAAYRPREGVVLMQVEVDSPENEISAAPQVLKQLDLPGKIVTGDALLTPRKLAQPIGDAGGNYVFPVKEKHPQLLQDIQTLFTPEACLKGFSPPPKDQRSAETLEKSHGRLERRTLTGSGDLKGALDWPYVEQVFKLEREFTQLTTGQVRHEVVYGVSRLKASEADAAPWRAISRRHGGIESGLPYRRDVTWHEDRSRLRMGHAPHLVAAINNVILGLMAHLGYTSAPQARRHFAAHVNEAVRLVLQAFP